MQKDSIVGERRITMRGNYLSFALLSRHANVILPTNSGGVKRGGSCLAGGDRPLFCWCVIWEGAKERSRSRHTGVFIVQTHEYTTHLVMHAWRAGKSCPMANGVLLCVREQTMCVDFTWFLRLNRHLGNYFLKIYSDTATTEKTGGIFFSHRLLTIKPPTSV